MKNLRKLTLSMFHQSGWKLAIIFGFSALLVMALGVAVFTGVRTASAATNGCPTGGTGNPQISNLVGASVSTSGSTSTYTFSSFQNLTPSGGIPGLIEYCVYPTDSSGNPLAPTLITVDPNLKGANGAAWTDPQQFDNFSFQRPDGNPSNIPLDGTTGITMGTATWSTLPANQMILLHINDATECDSLYGGNPGTCFVLPGTAPPPAQDLTVSKTAAPSFTRTFTWGISKSVDKTEIDIADSNSATFNYTVNVTHDSGTDSGWQVNGTITVTNPNTFDVNGVNVTDTIDNNGSCTVSGGTNVTVPAGKSTDLSYKCTFSSAPGSGTNTANATWPDIGSKNTSATGTANYDFSSVKPNVVDGSVTITDTLGGNLGTVSYNDLSPKTFTYSHTFTDDPGGTCTSHDNTATFTTSDTGTTGSASQTVKVCVGVDLKVTKDATPSFTRTYNWKIAKSVDKTLLDPGGTATYTVTVTETDFTDSAWQVSGTITVTNPNDWESITLTGVTDAVDNGGNCTVSGSTTATIAANGTATLSYSCTYSSAPTSSSGTNIATASWDKAAAFTPDGSAQGTHTFAFTTPTKTVNQTITVTDTIGGNLGSATATDSTPFTSKNFTYTHKFTPPASGCVTVNNTATIVETGQTASASVKNCNTGALTMGFWQNKNGQGIISAANQSALGSWLRQFHPFSDAPSSGLATYVYNIIKAANCSGTTCNTMLRAQMLATALDVYFSDGSLGGNKINAPAAIGGVTIDLTKICQMIDGSGGAATCSGTYEDVSSAFGGATSMTVSQMLTYQNTSDPAADAGANWYGQNKAMQVLAKDAFDAINNQVALAP